jgi:hypothetical protein
MGGLLFRLETVDGVAAQPSTLKSAVPNWKAGDSIYMGARTPRRSSSGERRAD